MPGKRREIILFRVRIAECAHAAHHIKTVFPAQSIRRFIQRTHAGVARCLKQGKLLRIPRKPPEGDADLPYCAPLMQRKRQRPQRDIQLIRYIRHMRERFLRAFVLQIRIAQLHACYGRAKPCSPQARPASPTTAST